jgi:polar amino acid transport system ATP-binding protein
MSFVKDFADYVLFMKDGEITEQGTPDMLDNPKTEELKAFMAKVR